MKFWNIYAFVAILYPALAAGCGIKAAPVPRETVVPAAVGDLRVEVVQEGIRLEWRFPGRSLDGSPLAAVAGFKVVRRGPDGERVRREEWFPISERKAKVGARMIWTDMHPPGKGVYTFWVVPFDAYGSSPPRGEGTALVCGGEAPCGDERAERP